MTTTAPDTLTEPDPLLSELSTARFYDAMLREYRDPATAAADIDAVNAKHQTMLDEFKAWVGLSGDTGGEHALKEEPE